MAVLVQFKIDGLEDGKKALEAFNKKLAELKSEAEKASASGLASFGKSLESTSRQLDKIGDSFEKAGRKLSLYVTAPIVAAGVGLFKMASDAIESENLFSVSMGNMQDSARDFSVELRKQLGLNEFETRKQIGTMFQMTTSMGLNREAAFDMSKGLTLLTNDMASFFNLKPAEAFQKLQAGITGEVEPLKRLGIIVNETTIAQTALTHGLIKQGETLDEKQKVMARYLTIVDQTRNAQGDLARTLDSPTNQMRILTGEFKQAAIELGMALMPAFKTFLENGLKPAIEFLKDVVAGFKNLQPPIQNTIIGFTLMAAALGPLLIALGLLSKGTALILGTTGLAGLATFLTGAAGVGLIATLKTIAITVSAVAASFSVGYAAASLFKNSITEFGKGSTGIIAGVKKDFADLGDFIMTPINKIKDGISGMLFVDGQDGKDAGKQFEDFAASIQAAMEKSAGAVKSAFGESERAADKLAMKEIKLLSEQRSRQSELYNFNRKIDQITEDFHEALADREIDRIKKVYGQNREAAYEAMRIERDRFSAMGNEGAAAAARISAAMKELETQITDRTFGGGARQALQDYIDRATDLGSVAKNIVGGAFQSLEQTISQFIQTGKLSFKSFVDSMKTALADFLASQIVAKFAKFLSGALSGSGGILGSLGSLLGGATGSAAAAGIGGSLFAGSAAAGGSFLAGGTTLAGGTSAGFIPGISALAGGGTATGGIGGMLASIGPVGLAAGAAAIVGGLILASRDKDYPYANATINVGPGGASVGGVSELDGGPAGEIRALAQSTADTFNQMIGELGVQAGNFSLQMGFVKPGRPGSLSGPYFAGTPGNFSGGATFEGLTTAQMAAEKALDYMAGRSPDVRAALIEKGMDVPAFATGGERIFSQPTMIMVGERPEKVSVSHLASGQGGSGMQIVFNGPNIMDQVSASRMAQLVSRSIRKQAGRGI